ncbi:hypothetical protein PGB90_000860 [Kerria lacca]
MESSGSSDPNASTETKPQSEEVPEENAEESEAESNVKAEEIYEEAESNIDDDEDDEDEMDMDEETEESTDDKKPRKVNKVMEYDISEMYPELSLLTEQTKKKWNYHDPDLIRALWLESKTNALAEWKVKHVKITFKKKPAIVVQLNQAMQVKQEYMERKKTEEQERKRKDSIMTDSGRRAPQFKQLKLPTTVTAQMRYKYNRDNPPVPEFYLRHFKKYKKPPFKTKTGIAGGCYKF